MVAFLPLPSVAIAVIFTVFFLPAFLLFTLPLDVTVAYFGLLDFQRIFLFAPFSALTIAFSLSAFPALTFFNRDLLYLSFHNSNHECFLSTASIHCYCCDSDFFACGFFANSYNSIFIYFYEFWIT